MMKFLYAGDNLSIKLESWRKGDSELEPELLEILKLELALIASAGEKKSLEDIAYGALSLVMADGA